MPTTYRRVSTPIGDVLVLANATGITHVALPGDLPELPDGAIEGGAIADQAAVELHEWFTGSRTAFDVPLAPHGTDFQRRVWTALIEVPYGATATYGAIAQAIGRPTATRAVGAANGRNPIPLIIPCHRIVGADGSLTGYSGAGGLAMKRRLLDRERGIIGLSA